MNPSEAPPSYEEAQATTPYPGGPPMPYPDQAKTDYSGYGPPPGGYAPPPGGYAPPPGGNQPYPVQPGANQPYPLQPGYPQQQYPYGAPGTQGPGGQNYTYPVATAAYNQQGVAVQPGVVRQNNVGLNYQRRRRIIFTVAACIFAFVFLSVILRVIL